MRETISKKFLDLLLVVRSKRSESLGCKNWNVGGCSKCYKVKAHFDYGNNLNCALNMV